MLIMQILWSELAPTAVGDMPYLIEWQVHLFCRRVQMSFYTRFRESMPI